MAMKILVVDDSITMVMSLKTTLTMNGFEVETANNGQQALDKLNAGCKPNLIVTDINMPVMGGPGADPQSCALCRVSSSSPSSL